MHPFAFVDKPVAYEQIKKLIIDVYEKLQIDDKFTFKCRKAYYNITLNRIMYFMSEKRIINVHCMDKIFTFYGKINDVEGNLKNKHDKVVLQNSASLEISRAKRESIRLMYMRKLAKQGKGVDRK